MRYRTILADPPWQYGDKLRMSDTARSSSSQYRTMTTDQVCALASWDAMNLLVAGFEVAEPAFLFLWVTNPFLLSGDGARVARAWGFEPKQLITWVKTKAAWELEGELVTEGQSNVLDAETIELLSKDDTGTAIETTCRLQEEGLQFGMGHLTRGVTEQIIVATRGTYSDLVKVRNERNVIFGPRRAHSQKPVEQYAKIERLVPGPYLELFARERREGWTSWGDELGEERA